ncbi:MAG: archaellin/type IV pilin N-terminal domain-containing protein, partial [Thermoplasmata archaeon]
MKAIYGKEKGVSPVIATILMVAITVVLASAVYLMVSGYIGTAPSKPALMAFS